MKNKHEKLTEFLEANETRKFEWGQWDCVLFAGAWLDYATGADYCDEHVGKYDDEDAATQYATDQFGGVDTVFDAYLLAINPVMAQRGDILLVSPPCTKKPTYCIVTGSGLAFAATTRVITYPRRLCTVQKGWRVE